MRLLHVFPSFARGGQQMRLAALADTLGSDFAHSVVSLDGDASAQSAFQTPVEVTTLRAAKSGGLSPGNILRLRRPLDEGQADILCTYNFGALEAAIANALGARLPHLHHEDGFGPDETADRQKIRRVLLRRILLRRSMTVVPSKTLEKAALTRWRLPPACVRRIPNGVDVARFANAARGRAPQDAVVVGSVGALRREKNYVRLIAAFAATAAPPAHLVIYGDGPERAALRQAAQAARGRIDLPGATAAPEAAFAGFDIFALSSDTEQMPLSLMEAMAAGLPVVSTDVGDIADMVAEENRPLVTPLGDERAFAAALKLMLADATLRSRLGAANALKARKEFALDAMIARYRALYLEMAGREFS